MTKKRSPDFWWRKSAPPRQNPSYVYVSLTIGPVLCQTMICRAKVVHWFMSYLWQPVWLCVLCRVQRCDRVCYSAKHTTWWQRMQQTLRTASQMMNCCSMVFTLRPRFVMNSADSFYRAAAMQPWSCHEHLSVCLSVCPSNAWIMPKFLHHMKGQCVLFFHMKNGWWGMFLIPEISDQSDPPLQKRRFPIYSVSRKETKMFLIISQTKLGRFW